MQHWMRKDIYQCFTHDEILLNLRVIDPGCFGPPLGDVVARNHDSGSNSEFTMIFQSASRREFVDGLPGASRVYSLALSRT